MPILYKDIPLCHLDTQITCKDTSLCDIDTLLPYNDTPFCHIDTLLPYRGSGGPATRIFYSLMKTLPSIIQIFYSLTEIVHPVTYCRFSPPTQRCFNLPLSYFTSLQMYWTPPLGYSTPLPRQSTLLLRYSAPLQRCSIFSCTYILIP